MKLFFSLTLIFISPCIGLELIKQVRKNIHASLQENVPHFYVTQWCKKQVEPSDLNDAIKYGRNEVVKCAFSHNPLLIKDTSFLFSAIDVNNCPAVQELLVQGAEVNCLNDQGKSPLECSLEKPDRNSSFIAGLLLAKKPHLSKNIFAQFKKNYTPNQVGYFANYIGHNHHDAALAIIPNLVTACDEGFLISWANKDLTLAKKTFNEVLDQDKKELLQKIFLGSDQVKNGKFNKELTEDQVHKLFRNYPFNTVRIFLTDEQVAQSVFVCDKDPALTADRQEISDVVQYIVNKPDLSSGVRHALCAPFLDDQKGQAALFSLMQREYQKKPFKKQDIEYTLEIGDHDYFDLIRRTDPFLIDAPLKDDGTTILMEAACKKYPKFVELPLSSDAILKTVENRSQNNNTALSCAIRADNRRAALVLLHCGAHVFTDQAAMEAVKDASGDMQKEIAMQLEKRVNYIIQCEMLYRETFNLIKQWHEMKQKIKQNAADELQLCPVLESSVQQGTHMDGYCTELEKIVDAQSGSGDLELCFPEFTLLLSDGPACFQSSEAIKEINCTLSNKIQKNSEILARDSNCSICLEDYSKKPRAVVCKNSHKICLKCYGSPALDKCPLCRNHFLVNKLTLCQTCHQKNENTKLFYCVQCDYTSIVCKECIHFPCCKRDSSLNKGQMFLNSVKSAEFAQSYLAHRQESLNLEYSQFEKEQAAKIVQIKESSEKRLSELEQQIEIMDLKIKKEVPYLDALRLKFEDAERETNEASAFFALDNTSFFRMNQYYDAYRNLKKAADAYRSTFGVLKNMEEEQNKLCSSYNSEVDRANKAIALAVEQLNKKRETNSSLLQWNYAKLNMMKNA